MIEIGDKIRFKPAAWLDNPEAYSFVTKQREVTGTVCYINEPHRYYRVVYERAPGCIGYECFKF